MFRTSPLIFNMLLMVAVFLSGCASQLAPNKSTSPSLNSEQRKAKLLNTHKWQLRGKIAFIEKIVNQKDKRESASINWRVDEKQKTQKLNLTSFLGINVLQLDSTKSFHTIKVDGKEYTGKDLSALIYSLTGLTLPTKALTFWLKGLPYNESDLVEINESTKLPKSLSSFYHNALWKIKYSNYQSFNGIDMATKFSIKKDGLLIKIAVKKWSLIE